MTEINTNQIADRMICVILIACAIYAVLKVAVFIIDIIVSYRKAKANPPKYELTPQGRKECKRYLKELQAKRKKILDAGIDTVYNTSIDYTPEELLEDVLLFGIDEYGDAWNSYGVTDHYTYEFPLNLRLGEDFKEVKKGAKHHG